jgi:hypothetical protein
MRQGQWLIFHLYDHNARTFEETVWMEWDSAEALVQEWKDKGYRLVLEGYGIEDSTYAGFPRFIPAGEMQRIWASTTSLFDDGSWPLPIRTWLFIWEASDAQSDNDAAPDDEPVTK